MGFVWIDVADIQVNSHAGVATVTLKRNWPHNEARLDDLPKDFREALLAWLTAKDESDAGA